MFISVVCTFWDAFGNGDTFSFCLYFYVFIPIVHVLNVTIIFNGEEPPPRFVCVPFLVM